MLLHIIPTMINGLYSANSTLTELSIPEIGLSLKAPLELATCTPYPNKNIAVGYHKAEEGSCEGFLIETVKALDSFTVISRWSKGDVQKVTHVVHNKIIDNDYMAVSQKMKLWGALSLLSQNWPDRWPKTYSSTPLAHFPVLSLKPVHEPHYRLFLRDNIDSDGNTFYRSEVFNLPTVERERITQGMDSAILVPQLCLTQQSGYFTLKKREVFIENLSDKHKP